MKIKHISIFLTFLFCLYLLSLPLLAEDAQNTVGAADIDGILASCGADNVQSFLNGTLTDTAGEGAEFWVIALRQRYSGLDFTAYTNALKAYIADKAETFTNPVSRERIALALAACGYTDLPFVQETADTCIGELGIMSEIFGLHLLQNGIVSEKYTTDALIDELCGRQHTDGSFSVTGSNGDTDVTAMAVAALAPHRDDPVVSAVVDAAIDWLAAHKTEDGQFTSYGMINAESSAQVIIALSSCGMNPSADVRFADVLSGLTAFRQADGGYAHVIDGETNRMATMQVFSAMIAMWRIQNGFGPLYIFTEESLPEYAVTMSETGQTADADVARDTETIVEKAPSPDVKSNLSDETAHPVQNNMKIRYILTGFIVIGIGTVFVLQWKKGKKHPGNYLIPLGIAALLIVCIFYIRIIPASEYYSGRYSVTDPVGEVTLTIRCDLVAGEAEYLPADGVILASSDIPIASGDSVYDVLVRAAQANRISLDVQGSGSYAYVAGIGYLYELAFGELSGWVYRVNGISPTVGCGLFTLTDGDVVEWLYTCDLGTDLAFYDGGIPE